MNIHRATVWCLGIGIPLCLLATAHAQGLGGSPPGGSGGGGAPGQTDVAGLHLDFKDIATTGISTAGLVISTSIFLQMLITKFASTFDRYRTLCGEYRDHAEGKRRDSLREQIGQYYRRCRQIRTASSLLLYTELVFLLTILTTSLTIVLPNAVWVKILASVTVVVGLVMLSTAVVMDLRENKIIAASIESESKDLTDLELKK